MNEPSQQLFDRIETAVDAEFPGMLRDLAELVSIPSVSSDPTKAAELERAALLVEAYFSSLGFNASIEVAAGEDGVEGSPAVIARGPKYEGAPTVLLYAHYDVQPAPHTPGWVSPPFEMEVRGDRIFGRGTSDDGAGVIVHLGALRALQALPNQTPLNVIVFIEGEEEIGSPTFGPFLDKFHDRLAADVIIVADSSNWTVDVPAITSTLRGVVSVDVTVKVADHAVHSGMFGGPLLDALTVASRLIATLHDEAGDVAVPGLTSSEEAEVDWDEETYRADASVLEGVELAGTGDLAARVWSKPAIGAIGIDAPAVNESANAIIPEATFRLSMRVPPSQKVEDAAEALAAHLTASAPFGATVEVAVQEMGPAYTADLDHEVVKDYREALSKAWGVDAVAIGQGASIPFIAKFEEAFPEAIIIVTGIEDPATKAHGENESQSVKILKNATVAEALFLAGLAEIV